MENTYLSEEVLKSRGWCYQFDLSVLPDQNEDSINEHIRKIYLSALQGLSNQKSKKMLKGPFYLWLGRRHVLSSHYQPVDAFLLIVTPYYQKVIGRDDDPIVHTMWQHKGYIRVESAIPILEGAVPACVFKDAQIKTIDLDEALISRLSDTFEEHQYLLTMTNPDMTLRSNPYDRIGEDFAKAIRMVR